MAIAPSETTWNVNHHQHNTSINTQLVSSPRLQPDYQQPNSSRIPADMPSDQYYLQQLHNSPAPGNTHLVNNMTAQRRGKLA